MARCYDQRQVLAEVAKGKTTPLEEVVYPVHQLEQLQKYERVYQYFRLLQRQFPLLFHKDRRVGQVRLGEILPDVEEAQPPLYVAKGVVYGA